MFMQSESFLRLTLREHVISGLARFLHTIELGYEILEDDKNIIINTDHPIYRLSHYNLTTVRRDGLRRFSLEGCGIQRVHLL